MSATPDAFAAACRRRDCLRAQGNTDAVRLLDGFGDGPQFGGLYIDDLAARWLVQTRHPSGEPPAWLRDLSPAPRSIYWKQLDVRARSEPLHWSGERIEAPFTVRENGLDYRIDFRAGYSQGLFLDQRDNRRKVRERLGSGQSLLNCFAYTCAFSVAAAAAGAGTVSVDLSRRLLDWGRDNFVLNGLDPDGGHEFITGDVFEWLRRFGKHGRRFHGIVLDPPTFSRNRDGRVFRVEHDFGELVRLATTLLAPDGWLLCTTNQRSLHGAVFRHAISEGWKAAGRPGRLETAPMPGDFTGEAYLQTIWVR